MTARDGLAVVLGGCARVLAIAGTSAGMHGGAAGRLVVAGPSARWPPRASSSRSFRSLARDPSLGLLDVGPRTLERSSLSPPERTPSARPSPSQLPPREAVRPHSASPAPLSLLLLLALVALVLDSSHVYRAAQVLAVRRVDLPPLVRPPPRDPTRRRPRRLHLHPPLVRPAPTHPHFDRLRRAPPGGPRQDMPPYAR